MTLSGIFLNYVYNQRTLYQLCASLAVYLAIKTIHYLRVRRRRYRLFQYYGIPGPKPNIFNGNYNLFRDIKADNDCRVKYGKTYGLFIGDQPSLMSTDLELLSKVFLENIKPFKDRVKLFIETPTIESVLFAPAHRWELFRKILSPAFSSYKIHDNESLEFVEESIKLMLGYIDNKFNFAKSAQGEYCNKKIKLDVIDLMKATTLRMISHMAINLPNVEIKENEKHVESLDEFLVKAGEGAVNMVIQYPFLKMPLQFLAKHFEYGTALKLINNSLNTTIDQTMLRLATEREVKNGPAPKKRTRLIHFLIHLHHEGKLTRSEVTANCMAILLAGYDTTSTTLTYIFWVLAKHTKVQEKLREDLMTYGTESQYLDQVIDETMRLYPTVLTFTSRLASKTVEVGGITIPQGTRVVFNAWLVHRDPEIWPDPLKFDPERFKPGSEYHPCAYAPFGLGIKKCLGYQLAKLELKMIVCGILLRYKIGLQSPIELELVTYSIFLSKPKDQVMLELERL